MIVDTHCHLNHEQLANDAWSAIQRAVAAGVERMIVVGYDLESSRAAVELANRHEEVYAAVAIHPHEALHYDDAAEEALRAWCDDPRVVAVGEIGLDYHYDFSPVEAQRSAFEAQLALARDARLPVIIHCREAYADTLDVLAEGLDRALSGVMHCWAGNADEAARALGLGMYLGIGGVLTFKNAEELRAIAAAGPLDRLLLETDAPYLAPVPYRGKRNEPAYTRLVAQKLAELRCLSVDDLSSITTQNAERLFTRLAQ